MILFLAGAGVGALIATVLFLCVMARTSRKITKETTETLALMRERNDLDREKIALLKPIADWHQENGGMR